MADDREYRSTPLQQRRADLNGPSEAHRDHLHSRKESAELPSVKPVGFLGKCFLLFIVVACFGSLFQSDVLWSEYDSIERTAYQSMESWPEAWSIHSIRTDNPLALSSYFIEEAIPFNPAIVHRGINLFLHIIAALLLLSCLNALKAPGALAATLVFSTHPAVIQTLFWPGYRSEIIGLIFILLALYSGIRNRGAAGYLFTIIFTTIASLIHSAAIAIPVIIIFVIILQNQKFQFHTFNRALPLICIALFLGVWTQDSATLEGTAKIKSSSEALNTYGENMFFFIKQSIFPLFVPLGLFHPVNNGDSYNVGASFSLLPFLVFIPFYVLAAINFKRTWARATLLGITSFLLLSLSGLDQQGRFLDGALALETHGLYVALPAITAVIFCGLRQLTRRIGAAGKILWISSFSLFFLFQLTFTASFAYTLGKPTTMWQAMSTRWNDSWVPKAAFIEAIKVDNSDIITLEGQIEMLTAILDIRPEMTEERKTLARVFKEAGQNSNAVREYKRILRESKQSNEFLEEAANFYDSVGLEWDARNARERIQR
ncbi:MAG: tetratricopeptide repeat protein [Lentimonas sp.]